MTNRFFSSLIAVFLLSFTWLAQAQDLESFVTLSTQKPFGQSISMWVKPQSNDTVRVDWGDGTLQTYVVNPNGAPYERKISGAILGPTFKVYGQFVELECNGEQLTACSFSNQNFLTLVNFKSNKLMQDMVDFAGAPNIENLNLDDNQMTLLDISMMSHLIYFSANNNPSLGGVLLPSTAGRLKQVSLSNCDISHFYPYSYPQLTSLNLEGNQIQELIFGDLYPQLKSLNVRNNLLSFIDVSECTLLTKLDISSNSIESINVGSNPELLSLFCAKNKLKKLSLDNNPKLVNLDCAYNLITQLDVTKLLSLSDLNVTGNQISALDLSQNTYLRSLRSAETLIPVFNFYNNNALRYIDVRNNSQMSPCAFNFMTSTMWPSSAKAWSANLLVDGSNAEGADFSTVTSTEYGWKLDITIDPSVPLVTCDSVDFTVVAATGGTISFSQFDPKENVYKPITNKAFMGAPIRYEQTPEETYTFMGLKVNDSLMRGNPFVVSQASTIEPVWQQLSRMILGTKFQQEISFALTTAEDAEITVDWGDGFPVAYQLTANNTTRLDDVAQGQSILIEGPVSVADFSSYPGMGLWDNEFTSLSVSNNRALTSLSIYMNPIAALQITNCPNIEDLDCAYAGLTALDVTQLSKLQKLQCYGNQLYTLDLSANKELRSLNARNNILSTVALEANTQLEEIDLQNNTLNRLDLSALPHLLTLKLSQNLLTHLDLSHNTLLQSLMVDHNLFTSLELSALQDLSVLYCNENKLAGLDLSKNTKLGYLNCAGNGFSACTLNDVYYSLPKRTDLAFQVSDNVFLRVSEGESAAPNEAITAESTLATIKGWTLNELGDGTGCPDAFVTVYPTENGSVKVTETATGKEVPSGSKLPKPTEITIQPIPNTGFEVGQISVNGTPLTGNTFTVSKATYIRVSFVTGIATSETKIKTPFVVYGNQIELLPDVMAAALFTANGEQVWQKEEDHTTPCLKPGSYILSAEWKGKKQAYKVLIP